MADSATHVALRLDDPARRRLLERVVVLQSRAAALLSANGRRGDAARAERYAARARLILDEPRATRHMQALVRGLNDGSGTGSLLERALDGAMSLIGADFGNVQIRDPITGSLRIMAESGFSSEFLEYFAVVDGDSSACGRAATQRTPTVIADVNEDPAFAPHRHIAAASGFRAVQSTPLIDRTGRLRGVISTHFRRPGHPSTRDLLLMEWYAELVAAVLAEQLRPARTLYEATAALHAHTAALHDDAAARLDDTAMTLLAGGDQEQSVRLEGWARGARERAKQQRERIDAASVRAQFDAWHTRGPAPSRRRERR